MLNGDLKEVVFRKLLSYATRVLTAQSKAGSPLNVGCAGLFLASIFEKSSEDEKSVFAKIVQDEHQLLIEKLFDVIALIWTKGKVSEICRHAVDRHGDNLH